MARIWLPSQSPIARTARGWPAVPNIQPKVRAKLKARFDNWLFGAPFIDPNVNVDKIQTLGTGGYAKAHQDGGASVSVPSPGGRAWDFAAADGIDIAPSSSGGKGSLWLEDRWSFFCRIKIVSYINPSSGRNAIVDWRTKSNDGPAFYTENNLITEGTGAYAGTGSTLFSGIANSVPVGEWVNIGITFDQYVSDKITFFSDGDYVTRTSTANAANNSFGWVSLFARKTFSSSVEDNDCEVEFFAFLPNEICSIAEGLAITRDPYGTLLEPANQSPFLIGSTAAGGITGTGALAAQTSAVAGTGKVEHTGTGDFDAQTSSIVGTGTVSGAITGIADLDAQASQISGVGEVEHTGTGALSAQTSAVAGTGTLDGAISGSGDLDSQTSTVDGTGVTERVGTGALAASAADVIGAGTITGPLTGTGDLNAQASQIAGVGAVSRVGTGDLDAQVATISGVGAVTQEITGTGALAAQSSSISGVDVIRIWTEVSDVSTTWTEVSDSGSQFS